MPNIILSGDNSINNNLNISTLLTKMITHT